MRTKSFHLQEFRNEDNTIFSVCGKISYEKDRINDEGPIIGPSIPFEHSENRCLRCFWQHEKDTKSNEVTGVRRT